EQRRPALVALAARVHLGAQLGEAGVHGRRGDGAGRDVERAPGEPDFEEADRQRAIGARAREVRRQLAPVAVFARRRDAGRDLRFREERADLLRLARQLLVVVEVLQLTAAATAEEGTSGDRRHGAQAT